MMRKREVKGRREGRGMAIKYGSSHSHTRSLSNFHSLCMSHIILTALSLSVSVSVCVLGGGRGDL